MAQSDTRLAQQFCALTCNLTDETGCESISGASCYRTGVALIVDGIEYGACIDPTT